MKESWRACLAAIGVGAVMGCSSPPATTTAAPLRALPELDLQRFLGTWYQVAWFPNAFQRACVSDTSARYALDEGRITVRNVCRRDGGRIDEIRGVARPVGRLEGGRLEPAQLEVSFLPTWLQAWSVGWAPYWVVQLADDGRYAVVSEPSRQYLWVLARAPALSPADDSEIRSRLQAQGFDLAKLQSHPHPAPIP